MYMYYIQVTSAKAGQEMHHVGFRILEGWREGEEGMEREYGPMHCMCIKEMY